MSHAQELLILSLLVNGLLAIALWCALRRVRDRTNELSYAEDARDEAELRTTIAIAGADLGVWEWDLGSERFVISPNALSMLGLQQSDYLETAYQWQQLIHPNELPLRMTKLHAYLQNPSGRYECEYRLWHKKGDWVWFMERGRLLNEEADESEHVMLGTLLEIETRKKMELELARLATTDPLTGLANRRLLQERLQLAWANVRRQPDHIVVLALCDIDYFKRINDTHGHDAGDAVLKHFGALLATNIRETDLAARFGGEEFMIILQDESIDKAQTWAQRLQEHLAAAPVTYGGNPLSYTISIGLAQLNGDSESIDEVLKSVDQALYRAKHNGRNQVAVAQPVGN